MNYRGNEISLKRPKLTGQPYLGEISEKSLVGKREEALNVHQDSLDTQNGH